MPTTHPQRRMGSPPLLEACTTPFLWQIRAERRRRGDRCYGKSSQTRKESVIALKKISGRRDPHGGRRCGSHRAETTGTVTREFTQLRTTCTRARPTAACLGLSGRLARDYKGCELPLKGPGVPVYIEVPEPPWFYDGVLLVYKVA